MSAISVLFVTHEINPIMAVVDRVLYLVGTRWAVGTPAEIFTSAKLSELYQTDVHEAAVTATEWGLRGVRKAEGSAESARLAIADVVAEARERVGEEVPPPAVADADRDHDH